MTAFGAIAEFSITEFGVAEPGVNIFIPVSYLTISAPLNDIVAGASISVPVTDIDITAGVNAPAAGTLIDIPQSQLIVSAPINQAVGGAYIDLRATYTAWAGFPIAGGAITEPPMAYEYRAATKISINAPLNDVVAGTLIDILPSIIELTAPNPEVIARQRKLRSIAISS